MRLVGGTVEGHFIGIQADARPWLAQACPQVLFAGHEINSSGLRRVGKNEVHQRVFRRFLPGFGDIVDCFPFELLQFRFFDGSDEHPGTAATVVEKVLPVGMIPGKFLFDARANGGIFQALKQFQGTTIRDPGRESGRERCCAGGIRIHVGGNVEAGVTRVLNVGSNSLHAAPAWLAAHLKVKNFNGEMRFLANANGFRKRLHFRSAFAAHVRGVHAAVPGGNLRQGDQLIGLCVDVGRIDQRAGNAQRAVFHGLLHERFHLIEFGGGGSAVVVADHRFADLRRADISANVEGRALFFQALEVAVERGPVNRELVVIQKRLHWRNGFLILRRDGAPFAGNFRGDSLRELAERAIVEQQRDFRLPEHIDETRRDDAALRIDFTLGVCVMQIANRRDASAAHGDISGKPRVPSAIDDVAVADEQIISSAGGGPGRTTEIGVIRSSGNFAERLTRDRLRRFHVRRKRDVIDVGRERQLLIVLGDHVADQALAVEHQFAVQLVFRAERAGLCEHVPRAR